jgi:proteasome activator subunit 3 (PA28 gamma)
MATDASVYPPPAADSVVTGDLQPKKRRLTADGDSEIGVITPTAGLNDIKQARYPNLFLANAHMATVHEIVKRECEDLADLCVCILLTAT